MLRGLFQPTPELGKSGLGLSIFICNGELQSFIMEATPGGLIRILYSTVKVLRGESSFHKDPREGQLSVGIPVFRCLCQQRKILVFGTLSLTRWAGCQIGKDDSGHEDQGKGHAIMPRSMPTRAIFASLNNDCADDHRDGISPLVPGSASCLASGHLPDPCFEPAIWSKCFPSG